MSLLVLPGDMLSELRIRSIVTHTWEGGGGRWEREGGREMKRGRKGRRQGVWEENDNRKGSLHSAR